MTSTIRLRDMTKEDILSAIDDSVVTYNEKSMGDNELRCNVLNHDTMAIDAALKGLGFDTVVLNFYQGWWLRREPLAEVTYAEGDVFISIYESEKEFCKNEKKGREFYGIE